MPKGVAAPDSLLGAGPTSALTLINDLRQELAGAKSRGQAAVPISALEQYLAAMEEAATSSTSQAEAQHRAARAKFEHEMDVWKVRMPLIFQSTIETGQAALKSAILINGGAAVALLAFVGNVVARGAKPGIGIGYAMLIFGGGVLLAALAAALTYLCQFSNEKEKLALTFNAAAIVTGSASLFAFGCGLWASFRAMSW